MLHRVSTLKFLVLRKYSTKPAWAELNGWKYEFELKKSVEDLWLWPKLFYLTSIIKFEEQGFRSPCKTNASALRKFPVSKFIGICFPFQRCFARAGMDNRTRGVVCWNFRSDLVLFRHRVKKYAFERVTRIFFSLALVRVSSGKLPNLRPLTQMREGESGAWGR